MLRCMSAIRTQVYLTDAQRSRIDALSKSEGLTMAEVIRRALDRYLADEVPDPESALSDTFGALPAAESPDRADWARG